MLDKTVKHSASECRVERIAISVVCCKKENSFLGVGVGGGGTMVPQGNFGKNINFIDYATLGINNLSISQALSISPSHPLSGLVDNTIDFNSKND